MAEEKNWYDRNYKLILLIPLIVFVIGFAYMAYFISENGDFVRKDVSLRGGTSVSVFDSDVIISDLESALESSFPDRKVREISDFRTGEQIGFFVVTSAESNEIVSFLEDYLGYQLNQDNSSVEFTDALLSEGFYKQLQWALGFAFIFMSIVVLVVFRTIIPSIAVIFAALSNIVLTVAVVNLIGMEMSIAGIVALLMIIGYSVDTDILLTSRLIRKRNESVNKRLYSAFETGMMMSLTSIAALGIAFLITYNFSDVLRQMFGILLIGLVFDIFNTWLGNAGILKWYVEKKL